MSNQEALWNLDFDAICNLFYGRTVAVEVADEDDFTPDPMELAKAIKEDEGL